MAAQVGMAFGLDPRSVESWEHDDLVLYYSFATQEQVSQRHWLEKILGVRWDRSDYELSKSASSKLGGAQIEHINLPLAASLSPALMRTVEGIFAQADRLKARGGLRPGEKLVELSSLPADEAEELLLKINSNRPPAELNEARLKVAELEQAAEKRSSLSRPPNR